jgi:hypothetical protein
MSGHCVSCAEAEEEQSAHGTSQRALNMPQTGLSLVTLSLKHFILRQRALSLYRTAVRASRGPSLFSLFAFF